MVRLTIAESKESREYSVNIFQWAGVVPNNPSAFSPEPAP
jgi:hypothetical protein